MRPGSYRCPPVLVATFVCTVVATRIILGLLWRRCGALGLQIIL